MIGVPRGPWLVCQPLVSLVPLHPTPKCSDWCKVLHPLLQIHAEHYDQECCGSMHPWHLQDILHRCLPIPLPTPLQPSHIEARCSPVHCPRLQRQAACLQAATARSLHRTTASTGQSMAQSPQRPSRCAQHTTDARSCARSSCPSDSRVCRPLKLPAGRLTSVQSPGSKANPHQQAAAAAGGLGVVVRGTVSAAAVSCDRRPCLKMLSSSSSSSSRGMDWRAALGSSRLSRRRGAAAAG